MTRFLSERLRAAIKLLGLPFALVAALYALGWLEALSLKTLDVFARINAQSVADPQVVVVAFDHDDTREFGSTNLQSNAMLQAVLTRTLQSEPKSIGIVQAINFAEPGGEALAELIAQHPKVLIMDKREISAISLAEESPPYAPLLAQSATQSIHTDGDRIVRRQLLSWPIGGQVSVRAVQDIDQAWRNLQAPAQARESSFCFRLAQLSLDDPSRLSIDMRGNLVLNGKAQQSIGPGDGDYVRTLGPAGPLILPRHASDMKLITFTEVLAPGFNQSALRNKVVLIGAVTESARSFQLSFQSLKSAYDVSYQVDIAAHQTAALIDAAQRNSQALRALPNSFSYFWILAWMLLCSWLLVPTSKPTQWLLIGGGCALALLSFAFVAYRLGWWLPVFAPVLGIAVVTFAAVTIVFRIETSLKAFADVTQRALNRIPEPIMVKDSLGRIRMVNESFCKLAGLTPQDLIGKNLASALPRWNLQGLMAHVGDYTSGETTPGEENNKPNKPLHKPAALSPEAESRSVGVDAEVFTDSIGRRYKLNLLTSRLPRPGRQDLIFALVRAFTPIGDAHLQALGTEALEHHMQQLRYWAQARGEQPVLHAIALEDFELLQEAYGEAATELLQREILTRLRRAFVSAFAVERSDAPGIFWLMRTSAIHLELESATQSALDSVFNWPVEVVDEQVELSARCVGQIAREIDSFQTLSFKLLKDLGVSTQGD
jgi:CHASE2 domain-containing sensor protein